MEDYIECGWSISLDKIVLGLEAVEGLSESTILLLGGPRCAIATT